MQELFASDDDSDVDDDGPEDTGGKGKINKTKRKQGY